MLRIIRELQPRWVVGENVLGLVNWDGGLVFEEVQADLESQGYEVQPYVLPACAVNAPHRRDRVWFVAYSKLRSAGQDGNSDKTQGGGDTSIHPQGQSGDSKAILDSGLCGLQGATPDADGSRRTKQYCPGEPSGTKHIAGDNCKGAFADTDKKRFSTKGASTELEGRRFGKHDTQSNQPSWHDFPTQSPVCSRDDGFSSRLDGITFPKWRNESIKAAGNAIVPQVAYQIFRAIELYEIQNGAK
jgi:DNA (cytosine-5)-methyltransferase 1